MFINGLTRFATLQSPEDGGGGGVSAAGDGGSAKPPVGGAGDQSKPPAGDDGKQAVISKADYDALKAKHEEDQKALERFKAAEKTEREKRQQAQKDQGEFKALAESLEKTLKEAQEELAKVKAEAATAKPAVERLSALEQGLKSRVEARLANGLPESFKLALKAMPDVNKQIAALEAYDKEQGIPPRSAPPSPTGGPPAGSTTTAALTPEKIAERVKKGETFDAIKATPEYAAMIEARRASPGKLPGFLGHLFQGAAGKPKG